MNIAALLAISFALAFLAGTLVEYILGTPMDKIPKLQPYKWLLQYVSLIAGVLFALYWKIDLIAAIAQLANQEIAVTTLGIVLSGSIMGRGANFLHQFVSKTTCCSPPHGGR